MNAEIDWKPDVADCQWLETTVGLLREGGTLIFPTSSLVYTVSHKTKTLTIVRAQIAKEWQFLHDRTVKTADLIGWTVKVIS